MKVNVLYHTNQELDQKQFTEKLAGSSKVVPASRCQIKKCGFPISRKVKRNIENMSNSIWKVLKMKSDMLFYHGN